MSRYGSETHPEVAAQQQLVMGLKGQYEALGVAPVAAAVGAAPAWGQAAPVAAVAPVAAADGAAPAWGQPSPAGSQPAPRPRLSAGSACRASPPSRLSRRPLSQHRNRLLSPPRPSRRRHHGFSPPLPPPPPRRRRGRQRTAPRTRACPRGRRPIRPSPRWSCWPAAWSWSSSNGQGTGPGSPRSTAGPAGSTPAGSCRGADPRPPRGDPTREARERRARCPPLMMSGPARPAARWGVV